MSTMDKIDCLKSLTENIVTKQNDSVESIKKLSQAVDSVSSDISNLINSLQMVGNRQFAENRIYEDNSLTGGDQLVDSSINQEQSRRTPHENSHIRSSRDLDVNFDGNELSLYSILHKATRLIPSRVDEDEDKDEDEHEHAHEHEPEPDHEYEYEPEHKHGHGHEHEHKHGHEQEDRDKADHSGAEIDIESKVVQRNLSNNGSKKDDGDIADKPSKEVKPIDRDRVADILKKYSLYDDDEDDEEDDYEGE